jgi:cysteine sulfinate desulfinase/cysteine desulfurase-like protein
MYWCLGSSPEAGLYAALELVGQQHLKGGREADDGCPVVATVLKRSSEERDRFQLNGYPTHRLPNTLNISITGTSGRHLLAAAPDIAAFAGSACCQRPAKIGSGPYFVIDMALARASVVDL